MILTVTCLILFRDVAEIVSIRIFYFFFLLSFFLSFSFNSFRAVEEKSTAGSISSQEWSPKESQEAKTLRFRHLF